MAVRAAAESLPGRLRVLLTRSSWWQEGVWALLLSSYSVYHTVAIRGRECSPGDPRWIAGPTMIVASVVGTIGVVISLLTLIAPPFTLLVPDAPTIAHLLLAEGTALGRRRAAWAARTSSASGSMRMLDWPRGSAKWFPTSVRTCTPLPCFLHPARPALPRLRKPQGRGTCRRR